MLKKRAAKLLSMLLSLALVISCLCAPSYGFFVNIFSVDGTQIGYEQFNANGESETVLLDLYDADGNLLYWKVDDMEYEATDHPVTPAELEQLAKEKQSELESKYACKIQWLRTESGLNKLYTLRDLEAEFQKIPAPLLEATTNAFRNQMGTFTIQFVDRSVIPDERHDGMANGDASSATIWLIATSALVHEYGHIVHLSLLNTKYGSGALQSRWTAQNNGSGYGEDYNYNDPVFVRDYAGTDYFEDIAETFAYIMGDAYAGRSLTFSAPGSIAVKKMEYMRQLLSEAFGVSTSIFTSTEPSAPSSWAQSGVQEYLDMFSSQILACNYQLFEPGYQSGTTRRDFARAAHGNVANLLLSDIYGKDRDAGNAFAQKWHLWQYETQLPANANPFTDLISPYNGRLGNGNYAVVALYLNGVVSGSSSTTFNPDGLITRQEAASMLYRLCEALGYQFPKERVTFADDDAIASWAKDAVGAVAAAGIMSGVGDNKFDPQALYTYEQSALTMVRVYKLLSGK